MSETVIVRLGGAPGGATGVHSTVRLSLVMDMVPSCFLYEVDARTMATDIKMAVENDDDELNHDQAEVEVEMWRCPLRLWRWICRGP
jgi:hypothetical protein